MTPRGSRVVASLLAGLLVLSAVTGVAVATGEEQVIGRPDLDLSLAENRVQPGTQLTLQFGLSNSGQLRSGGPEALQQEVRTARNVRMTVAESKDGTVTVKTGTQTLGTMGHGAVKTVPVVVEIPETATPGTYRIPVEIRYDYSVIANYDPINAAPGYTDVSYAGSSRTEREVVTVVVEDEPRFRVANQSSEAVTAGDTGTLSFSIENIGTQSARSARVRLQSSSPAVQFGDRTNPSRNLDTYVDSLAPGETTTVTTQVVTTRDVAPGTYPVDAQVEYEDPNGIPDRSRSMVVGVDVRDEQTFRITAVNSTLRVGDDGTVSGRMVNEGPNPVRNAVVVFQPSSRTLHASETEYAVGDLPSGEAAHFAFEFDVSQEADPGPRMLSYVVRYRNVDDEIRRSTPVDAAVGVGAEVNQFDVDRGRTTVKAGSSGTITIHVTNTGTEPVTDIEAKLFVDDTLSSANDQAFVSRLGPNETATLLFDVGAASGIIAKEYPVAVDFSYEDESGDTELSDTYRVPITVTEPVERDRPWPLIGGVGLLAGAAILGVFARRRGWLDRLR